MSKQIESFQKNIRKTFLLFSLTPVIGVVLAAIILFGFTWSYLVGTSNRRDNDEITSETRQVLESCHKMLGEVERAVGEDKSSVDSKRNEVFEALYRKEASDGELGNLMILSSDMEILFSSKGNIPSYLIRKEYANWGVWNQIRSFPGETVDTLYGGVLFVSRGVYQGNELSYVIIYQTSPEPFKEIVDKRNRSCIISDENGWVYISNTQKMIDEFGQIIEGFNRNSGYITIDGQKYIYSRSNKAGNLRVYTFSDINRSITVVLYLAVIVVVIFVAIIFITLRSTSVTSEIYTRDVKKIETAFEKVQQGDLETSLSIDSNREFQTIGNDFNEMIKGLKEQNERNKELAQNAAFAQVKQLESQFNPHFLFNTLDNIRFMAKIDPDAADKMIVSLSGLLRYSIREMRDEVTVREDFEHLQYYLNILKIRFNRRFDYEIDVAEDIMECLIPKLLLQPILENAVKYGFGEKEKLTVRVTGYQIQEKLIFVCEDDGAGMEEEALGAIKRQLSSEDETTEHFGIYNIDRRIKLMYQGDYGLDIISRKGEGTSVRLTIPKKVE